VYACTFIEPEIKRGLISEAAISAGDECDLLRHEKTPLCSFGFGARGKGAGFSVVKPPR
jgi:hypothetical protein